MRQHVGQRHRQFGAEQESTRTARKQTFKHSLLPAVSEQK